MMVIRVDGQVYESTLIDLAQKFALVFAGSAIPVDATFTKGNLTYLRVDPNTNRFGFFSKPMATIFGLPPNDWVNEVKLRNDLEEALGMEVNFVK